MTAISITLLAFIVACLLQLANANPCKLLTDQSELDSCYMREALNFALLENPRLPFGALIVDHTTNDISCYGVNSDRKDALLHGESAAFLNCTELYPSPTGNDARDPGLDYSKHTLYTTGEPCPMCSAQSFYRGITRVVWGTSIPDINKSGSYQLYIRANDVLASAKAGGGGPYSKIPKIEGGILKDECDRAFWCSFTSFRSTNYYKWMSELGEDEYIKNRNERFNCTASS
ncbi:secreted cytidine and deoxycytidylate deaminase [Phycomyces blakesleeanus]|uniref:Secreted cytidine and deoxycytidylate deaminase n=2 Tax=Phycomyces blakesleeanus TaxID=4837 RepID=A0A167LLW9_PHYB8|nr:secreted cytidine and deoxycytidylate deaminase [Phycomyces blakesleeanus NRRL 1555(-)]OAD70717.1 secreted cytidine and deoxycytidylate deaminase [Phycomyces blakesleeanus NRRL 1555(-)]|eukprot:XP_018288757.1 secreted cytidine and deoxycytidylate deaminase [Phycomyces blakesleeanus NRRL 1555(-)]